MKTFPFKGSLNLIVITIVTSCSIENDGIFFDRASETKTEYSIKELEILDLVNSYRITIGMNSLKKLEFISSVDLARPYYTNDKGKTSHYNFSEKYEIFPLKTIEKSVEENANYGYSFFQSDVNSWIRSHENRKLILNENYTHFGIYTDQNNEGRIFFNLMFTKQ